MTVEVKPKKVLILGNRGFVGRNIENLLNNGAHDVHGLGRTTGCDLLDFEASRNAIERVRPDYIVNCAAHVGSAGFLKEFAADVVDQNMRMILNLYKILRNLGETVLINPVANCAFPGNLDSCREQDLWAGAMDPNVVSYGSTRRMLEVLSQCYRSQAGVRSVNLLAPGMYGPHDGTDLNKIHALNALVIKFVSAMKRGDDEVEVRGTGKPVREWLFVKDMARLIQELIDSGREFIGPVNVAQNHGLSIDELVSIIVDRLGYKGRVRKNLSYSDGSMKKVMDDGLFRRHFPSFRFTEFSRGLDETIGYYQGAL